MTNGEYVAQQPTPLKALEQYCFTVATSNDNAELVWVEPYARKLYTDDPASITGLANTLHLRNAIVDRDDQPEDTVVQDQVQRARLATLSALYPSVLLGQQVELLELDDALNIVRNSLLNLGVPDQNIDLRQKHAALAAWKIGGMKNARNLFLQERAAVTYRTVGSPLRFGWMMAKLATWEQSDLKKTRREY